MKGRRFGVWVGAARALWRRTPEHRQARLRRSSLGHRPGEGPAWAESGGIEAFGLYSTLKGAGAGDRIVYTLEGRGEVMGCARLRGAVA